MKTTIVPKLDWFQRLAFLELWDRRHKSSMEECQMRSHVPYPHPFKCSQCKPLALRGFKGSHRTEFQWFKAEQSARIQSMIVFLAEVRSVQEMSEDHEGAGHKKQSTQFQVSVFAFLTPKRDLRNS